MNDTRRFEVFVADQFERARENAQATDSALDDINLRAAGTRQRPRWLALIKEPPMRTNSQLAVGSPAVRVAAVLVAIFLLAMLTLGAGIAGSRLLAADDVFIVAQDGSGDYTSITEAVTVATDGDTILVRPGTYDEAVLVTTDVTIRGDGDRSDIIIERTGDLPQGLGKWGDAALPYAIRLEHTDASIENLSLRGKASRISVVGGSPTMTQLTLQGLGNLGEDAPIHDDRGTWMAGLELMDGTTASLSDSDIVDTHLVVDTAASPTLEANLISRGWALIQGDGVAPVVRDNAFEDSWKESIWVGGGAKPEIADNSFSFSNTSTCVRVEDALTDPTGPNRAGTDPTVRGNSFRECQVGISMARWTSATIEKNEFHGSTTGIRFLDEADAAIVANVIRDGRTGVEITRGEPVLTDNSITGNKVGLVLHRPAKPVMSGNVICDNETNVRLMTGAEMPDTEANEICPDG
jgi:hypothetical protein